MVELKPDALVGSTAETQKVSLRVALLIEDDLLHHGWRGLVGSQKGLQDRFGLGRCAFRETAKVLEIRGSARTKRGPQGGLWALAPNRENFARRLAAFLVFSHGKHGALSEAVAAADSLRSPGLGNAAEAFLTFLLKRAGDIIRAGQASSYLLAPAAGPASALFGLCCGHQLAARIIDDIARLDPGQPQCIGSEWDLAERYGYRLETIRQASRMLESMGLVEVRMGRGGGIFTRMPQLMLSRGQLFSYLSTQGVTCDQARALAASMRAQGGPVFDPLLGPIDEYAAWALSMSVPVPAAA